MRAGPGGVSGVAEWQVGGAAAAGARDAVAAIASPAARRADWGDLNWNLVTDLEEASHSFIAMVLGGVLRDCLLSLVEGPALARLFLGLFVLVLLPVETLNNGVNSFRLLVLHVGLFGLALAALGLPRFSLPWSRSLTLSLAASLHT